MLKKSDIKLWDILQARVDGRRVQVIQVDADPRVIGKFAVKSGYDTERFFPEELEYVREVMR